MEKVPFVDNIKELDEFIGIWAVEKDLPDSLNFLKRWESNLAYLKDIVISS